MAPSLNNLDQRPSHAWYQVGLSVALAAGHNFTIGILSAPPPKSEPYVLILLFRIRKPIL